VATTVYSYLTGTGYFNQVLGYNTVYAIAHDATDKAFFYDSGGNTFVSNPSASWLSGAGFMFEAIGFGAVTAQSQSKNDVALIYDSAGNDVLGASGSIATLQSSTCFVTVSGFGNVTATRSTGTDLQYRAQINFTLNVVGGWKLATTG